MNDPTLAACAARRAACSIRLVRAARAAMHRASEDIARTYHERRADILRTSFENVPASARDAAARYARACAVLEMALADADLAARQLARAARIATR